MALVALTGHGMPEDRERSRQAGFDFHVVKPVDFDDLATVIEKASGSVRLRSQSSD
jgi:CheY-like chemotaxis protein